jgi:hypothetical protein
MVLCAVILFVVGSAVVAFHGWTQLGIGAGPATQTLQAREDKSHAAHARMTASVQATPTARGGPHATALRVTTLGQPRPASGSAGPARRPRRPATGHRNPRSSQVSHHRPAPAPATTTTSPTTTGTPAPTSASTTTTPTAATSSVTVTVPIGGRPSAPHPAGPGVPVSHRGHGSPWPGPSHQRPGLVGPTHPVHPTHPAHPHPTRPGGIPSAQSPAPTPAPGPPVSHPAPGPPHVHPAPGPPLGHPSPGHIGRPDPGPGAPGPGGPRGTAAAKGLKLDQLLLVSLGEAARLRCPRAGAWDPSTHSRALDPSPASPLRALPRAGGPGRPPRVVADA